MEPTEISSTVDTKSHISPDAYDTSESYDLTHAPPETAAHAQHRPKSISTIEAFDEPGSSLQAQDSIHPATTEGNIPLTNPILTGIDWPDFNAPIVPIPGHPLNELFPEIMKDDPELSDPVNCWPDSDHSVSNLTSMDHVGDSADLCNRDIDLANIDVSDYEGVIVGLDRPEEEDLLAETPHADVVTDEAGSVPMTSNTSWTNEKNESDAEPAYAHDSDAWISQMTSEDFDRAITEYFTSQAQEEMSLSLRTRTGS
ncbi:MAG: hypothetical protein Q9204_008005 [Flavoplaca sp. TL-2023a]